MVFLDPVSQKLSFFQEKWIARAFNSCLGKVSFHSEIECIQKVIGFTWITILNTIQLRSTDFYLEIT